MPSVNPQTARFGALLACASLLTGAAAGCSTTQEKAERQQARSEHILKARAERQKRKAGGPKAHAQRVKSAHRPEKEEQ